MYISMYVYVYIYTPTYSSDLSPSWKADSRSPCQKKYTALYGTWSFKAKSIRAYSGLYPEPYGSCPRDQTPSLSNQI
jgi:hypothetical protein